MSVTISIQTRGPDIKRDGISKIVTVTYERSKTFWIKPLFYVEQQTMRVHAICNSMRTSLELNVLCQSSDIEEGALDLFEAMKQVAAEIDGKTVVCPHEDLFALNYYLREAGQDPVTKHQFISNKE